MVIKKEKLTTAFIASSVIGAGISYSSIYLFHIMLALLTGMTFVMYSIRGKAKKLVLPSKLHYFFYFFIAWYSISIIWSIDRAYSLKYLSFVIFGCITSLVIVRYATNTTKLDNTFKVISSIFIIEIIFSLLEVFTPFRLPISPFSKYITLFGRSGTELLLEHYTTRATGFRWNPNTLATTMTLIMPFFLLYPKKKVALLGTIAISLIVFFSSSRANILALIVVVLLYAFFKNKKRFFLGLLIIPLVSLLFVGTWDVLRKNSDNALITTIDDSFIALNMYLFDEVDGGGSISSRQQLTKNGLDALINTYGLGVGGGGSEKVQENLGYVSGRYTKMHNFWIEILVDGGVVFAVTFAIWYLKLIIMLNRISSRSHEKKMKYWSKAAVFSLIAFIPGAVSASTVMYFFPMWILFGFSVAIINIDKWSEKTFLKDGIC